MREIPRYTKDNILELKRSFTIAIRFHSPHNSTAMIVLYIDRIHFQLVCPKKTLNEMMNTVRHFGLLRGGLLVPLSETNVSGKFGFNVHDTCSTTSSSGSIHITPTDPMLAMAQALRVASQSIANMSAGQNANSVEPSSTAPFSDAIASQITLSPTKQSYPYYLRNETLAGIPYDVYHHIDTSFDCTITRSDLEGKLFVAQRDGALVSVNFVEGFRPGTWFKEMVSEYIPDHIVMRAHEAKCYPLPGNRSSLARGGTPISHPYHVMFNG